MGSSRFRALSYLGHRALVAHPVNRLARGGAGLERLLANCRGGVPISRITGYLLDRAREQSAAAATP